MYNKRIKFLIIICLLITVMSACKKKVEEVVFNVYTSEEESKEDIVVKNGSLELHFQPATTQFYIVDTRTGNTWYSNPGDAQNDALALGINKKDLMSTISLKYNTESGSATMMTSYGSSVERGNFNYEVLDNGIRVNYTIADMDREYIIPTGVGESRFNQFFDLIDESKKTLIKTNFKIYDINNIRRGENKDELLATYPAYETEKVYVFRESSNKQLMLMIEELFAQAGYTQEDYVTDTADLEGRGLKDIPMFNVTIEYLLENDTLVVNVPMDKIEYRQKYPIVEIRPLTYFGTAGTQEEGFILVPDGNGGIIRYNNGKNKQNPYRADVYGFDFALYRDSLVDENRANLPVFGMSNQQGSFLCILEDGSSHAVIEAMVSGALNSYNYANTSYNLLRSALMDISSKSNAAIRRFQESLPEENLSQRYVFIGESDYSSMAVAYREYLMDRYPELAKAEESQVPMMVELIGAVDRTKHVLGIPTRQPDELTSYKEAKEIIERLASNGVSNFGVKYNGWFNKGILHSVPNKVNLISELGSKKDFKALVKSADENNVDLYLASSIQFIYKNGKFDNFMAIRDTAKLVSQELVELTPFSPVFYAPATWLYEYSLAKPSYYIKNMEAYAKEIKKLGVMNIAFEDIGKELSADYNKKDSVTREAAMKLQVEELAKLKASGYNMAINSGNLYAIPYASFITNMNLGTKGYHVIDEEIPFKSIVFHGLVPYAGEPLNITGNRDREFLKTVETGAGLYFTFMAADSFDLQDSRYIYYYSADIDDWEEEAVAIYHQLKNDLGHVYNQYIVKHENVAEGVSVTEYEDGTKVIVNYNANAYTYQGKVVPAKNYIVEGGKQ